MNAPFDGRPTTDPADAPVAPPVGEVRYGFELAGLRLVPAQGVLTELVAHAKVFRVPRSSGSLAGVINLHGTIVPVVDPDQAGQAGADLRPVQHATLVFDREEQRVGVLLKSAPTLLNLLPVAAGSAARPGQPLARFVTRAWVQADPSDSGDPVWWELDHRAAFEWLARGADPVPTPPVASAGASMTEVTP
jgi:chemotaxis signal transduction protein